MKKLLNAFTKPRTDPFALYRVPPAPMYPQPPVQGRFKPHWMHHLTAKSNSKNSV